MNNFMVQWFDNGWHDYQSHDSYKDAESQFGIQLDRMPEVQWRIVMVIVSE